jgi:hypothetical protein
MTKLAGRVATMGKREYARMDLAGKPDGKGSLGRYKRRWENNNKMDLSVIGWV